MDAFGFFSTVDFIQFLYSPPFTNQHSQKNDLLLFGAILCDGIWKLRNQVIFEDLPLRCDELISRVWKLFMESKISRPVATSSVNIDQPLQTQSPPRHLSVKINVDVVIGPNYSSLALVARDWRGDLVFACSQKAKTTFPLQAEAESVRWAISLATNLEAENVIIETDSKICQDAIHELMMPPPWRIASILADMQCLLVTYSNVPILWVCRLTNMAAHSLVKWSLACNIFSSINQFFPIHMHKILYFMYYI